MRIACLQFAPQVGDIENNLNRADAVLSRANPKDLDLLVLPELAFTGYNFRSLKHINPFLEPTTSGITSLWARTAALKYNCVVTVGYPEKVDVSPRWPTSQEYYNSAVTVNSEGETIANYRKSFLYYTDETWALEGPDGFYNGQIQGLGNVAMGICMDLNPYKFEAPWTAWEFAHHVLHKEANLVIMSMAWLTNESASTFSRFPKEPDMETLSYWLARLEPLIRAETEGEIIVVLANRTGTEDEVVYAGTSTVLGIQDGEVRVYGLLGRGEKELLVVDTDERPQAKLISEPNSAVSNLPGGDEVSEEEQGEEDEEEEEEEEEEPKEPVIRTRSRTSSWVSSRPSLGPNLTSPGLDFSKNEISVTGEILASMEAISANATPTSRHPQSPGSPGGNPRQPPTQKFPVIAKPTTTTSMQSPPISPREAPSPKSPRAMSPFEEPQAQLQSGPRNPILFIPVTKTENLVSADGSGTKSATSTFSSQMGSILSTGRSEPKSATSPRPMSTIW